MKGKRLKKYRKEMRQYQLNFGFREPYQALCDSEVLVDAERMRLDFAGRLKGVLGGEVKIMVSQCSMRHLYNAKQKNEALIAHAKNFERRRCGHHELEEPLDTHDCITECVGPSNKHRYVVVTQDPKTRAAMRQVPGVPIVYIAKSVMILEPMAEATEDAREREEKAKFRAGLKGRGNADAGQKRKRDDDEESAGQQDESAERQSGSSSQRQKKKRARGPKQPNPLSMKKSAKKQPSQAERKTTTKPSSADGQTEDSKADGSGSRGDEGGKRKRKRKPKTQGQGQEDGATPVEVDASTS
ncbi:hypothetical protein BU24DRAFT_372413 [Aaosphaeria arxii CBS 175.79]|uniref:U three protein 23 n=1 Tax=Aaosphaeria arxii CBS 175.79 TaxID=1450172 RepID=A0A6A5XK67_9PLEO|nr:uncharacterized protein BU24DRAFT_372413 [Aaosphaeria arxii CBS 175.79]KAF2013207.1 hypothetical protein BU24DRAFT_372413 [Aaosphaeria arxii CBS 175.79]